MELSYWGGFILLIIFLLYLDLGVINKKAHEVKTKEALLWTLFWIFIALLFNVFVYYAYELDWIHSIGKGAEDLTGYEASLKYFTGYVIEKSLSLDNIFVIAMIFSYFQVPLKYQHEILFWGILGAIIFRGIMIVLGTALINEFDWITYIFGVFLLISAVKMMTTGEDEEYTPSKNPFLKLAKKIYPVTETVNGKFFLVINGVKHITPLFVVLVVIETTDIMFAVDSIPAIFSVTTDSFIVFTSNIFAILGLRSLYFVLAAMMEKFKFIKMSLVFVLGFVGVKMLLIHHYQFETWVSLSVILGLLLIGVLASIYNNYKHKNDLL
jgi:tellurite resistance protein TerC